jgi:hypothetical protein
MNGRPISFWLHQHELDYLTQLANARGVSRNRALRDLIEQARQSDCEASSRNDTSS